MELHSKDLLSLVCIILLLPALCTSQDGFTYSRATYYGSPDCYGSPKGACGFGEYGRTVNDGSVTGVCGLWKNGSGCGACYQVRCKIPDYCDDDGAYVVVTDFGVGDNTDFVMSPRAYSRLGRNPDASAKLFKCGVVDVEYRRVPCRYSYNILVKVHEHSRNPHYLAIVVLYVGGTTDITAVELWREDCQEWRPMRRVFGVVFDYENPPRAQINLRFQVNGQADWVPLKRPLPSTWEAGAAYETDIQFD
ncbi:hypothetical protein L6164_019678 [Bauhinia variegata]|uniref:Uncharacterized protein n=1 Tax=Bauhinia variegata TaxID=167791 RepID=A0ACB9MT11_BAUVA|nr:hypothetical protein L6164_019678 [Bauhinia variegata]